MKNFNVKKGSTSIFLAAAIVAILLLSLWPNAWATPLQEPLCQTVPTPAPGQAVGTFTPEEGGTLNSPAGDVTIAAPPRCLTETISLVYTPWTVEEAPPTRAGFRLLGHVFTLEAFRGLELIPGYAFACPVKICIFYTAGDVTNAGGDPHNILVQYYDEAKEEWVDLDTTIDTEAGTACVEMTHLTWFALAAVVPARLPITGAEMDIDLKLAIVPLVGMLLAALAGFHFWRAKRVR